MEREVGPDLAELRNLQEQSSGDSDLRRKAVEIENELRQAKVAETNNRELLKLLTAARDNPGTLLATPNRLLESQPALKRLKDGLVDAQLRTAQHLGTMTHEHPLVGACAGQRASHRTRSAQGTAVGRGQFGSRRADDDRTGRDARAAIEHHQGTAGKTGCRPRNTRTWRRCWPR